VQVGWNEQRLWQASLSRQCPPPKEKSKKKKIFLKGKKKAPKKKTCCNGERGRRRSNWGRQNRLIHVNTRMAVRFETLYDKGGGGKRGRKGTRGRANLRAKRGLEERLAGGIDPKKDSRDLVICLRRRPVRIVPIKTTIQGPSTKDTGRGGEVGIFGGTGLEKRDATGKRNIIPGWFSPNGLRRNLARKS